MVKKTFLLPDSYGSVLEVTQIVRQHLSKVFTTETN